MTAPGIHAEPAPAPVACVNLEGNPTPPNATNDKGQVTRVTTPVLRLLHTAAERSKGTVLIFPSGGYHVLSIVSDGTDKAKFWNNLGYDAAILEYTISEKGWQRDDAVRDLAKKDALAACTLLRTRGNEWGLRGERFILMGGSAGGHLAARTVAALPAAERPELLVLFYPAYLEETAPGANDPGMPLPEGKLPRLFAVMAANDNSGWIKGLRGYQTAWEKAGGRTEVEVFSDGGHGFAPGSKAASAWQAPLAKFVNER